MMKLVRIFLISCVFVDAYGIPNEVKEYTYQPQGIIFVIDRENQDYESARATNFSDAGALPANLDLLLIARNDAPIVASKSVLAALSQWYLSIEDEKSKELYPRLKKTWAIKEIEDFYILYKNDKIASYKGLKLENLTSVNWDQAERFVPSTTNKRPFTDILSQMFAPKQEFEKNSSTSIPSWMIYIDSHGLQGEMIAGLSLDEFKKLTNFLDKKIVTKVLLYNSCFAGGINKIKGFESVYKKQVEQEQALLSQQVFTFPVIILSITDAITFTVSSFSYNFNYLFEQLALQSYDIPDYFTILKKAGFYASSEKNANGRHDIFTANLPQIRLPNTEWFSVESVNKIKNNRDYAVITKVQGQTREKPLTIEKTVKTILIYSPTVPFTITISHATTDRVPRIVLMDFLSVARFAEIRAPQLTFQEICRLFMPLDASMRQGFYIDSLIFLNNNLTNCLLMSNLNASSEYEFTLIGNSDPKTGITYHAIVPAGMLNDIGTAPAIALEKVTSTPAPVMLPLEIPEGLRFDQIGKKIQKTLTKKPLS